MSIPDLSRLIELCNEENEKQIFISIDKTNACSKQAQDIITDKMVIKFDNNEFCLSVKNAVQRRKNEDPIQQTLEDFNW